MIDLKAAVIYSALVSALCGGVGYYAATPSQADFDRAMGQRQQAQARDCDSGREFRKGQFQNSRGQGF